jgi:hypothetical protein
VFKEVAVRLRVTLDDERLALAREYTGIDDPSILVTKGLKELIDREIRRRKLILSGSRARLKPPPAERKRK